MDHTIGFSEICAKFSVFYIDSMYFLALNIDELTGQTSLVDSGLKHLITNHPEMTVLRICQSTFSDQGLQIILTRAAGLRHLLLQLCPDLTGDGIEARRAENEHCHHPLELESLEMIALLNLSDTGLANITSHIKLDILESLVMSGCQRISKPALSMLVNRTSASLRILCLQSLDFTGCLWHHSLVPLDNLEELDISHSKIDDAGLVSLINKIGSNLKKLNLSYVADISFSEIDSLVTLSKLESLNISHCWRIKDASFITLINKVGRRLKSLSLAGLLISMCRAGSLSPTGLSNLEQLDISYCKYVQMENLAIFLAKAPLKKIIRKSTNITRENVLALFPTVVFVDVPFNFISF